MARKARTVEPVTSETATFPGHVGGCIELEGVRVHNLRGFNLRIRHHALTAICGVSGSGKSSLAFDTLYAEGQRRYIETFSPSARQFLDRIERPAVDRITGLPPAIAIRQQQRNDGLRSTLGTRTEIIDYLRILFARAGDTVCPDCSLIVRSVNAEAAAQTVLESCDGRLMVLCDVIPTEDVSQCIDQLIRGGFTRAIQDGHIVRLEEMDRTSCLPSLTVIVDRLKVDPTIRNRLAETIATAMDVGSGRCTVLAERLTNEVNSVPLSPALAMPPKLQVDASDWDVVNLSRRRECQRCRREFPEPTPELLSFASPLGACPTCEGTGLVRQKPGRVSKGRATATQTTDAPSEHCSSCCGTRLKPDADAIRLAGKTLTEVTAMECGELLEWLNNLATFNQTMSSNVSLASVLRPAFDQATRRLRVLLDLGLGYLSIDRAMPTLSGGEAQRAALSAALGSGLINTLYVLDEPTAGLHANDTQKVLEKIRELQRRGNTVVVVEHDPTVVLAADEVIEIGPGAGDQGGALIFQGTPRELLAADTTSGVRFRDYAQSTSTQIAVAGSTASAATSNQRRKKGDATSATGDSLTTAKTAVRQPEQWLDLWGVECHNIRGLDVRVPLGVFCAIVGVSGSGKSSLIADSMYPELCRILNLPSQRLSKGRIARIDGVQQLENVLLLDQSPILRSRRSIPATWIGVFDDIRVLLSETHEARKRNFSRAMFSFNSASGGRCPVCEGRGIVTVAMQFLADIETSCEECHGQRFRPDVLEIRYRDRSVDDILNMTADDAFVFFNGHHRIQQRLNAMRQSGLGYVRLGQPLSTISGGEAQRLRIAALLAGLPLLDGDTSAENRKTPSITRAGRTLFLLDEPSAGLHLKDVDHLVTCMDFLVQMGHSVVIIDHDVALTSRADWIIELGPGPGKLGGTVVSSSRR